MKNQWSFRTIKAKGAMCSHFHGEAKLRPRDTWKPLLATTILLLYAALKGGIFVAHSKWDLLRPSSGCHLACPCPQSGPPHPTSWPHPWSPAPAFPFQNSPSWPSLKIDLADPTQAFSRRTWHPNPSKTIWNWQEWANAVHLVNRFILELVQTDLCPLLLQNGCY